MILTENLIRIYETDRTTKDSIDNGREWVAAMKEHSSCLRIGDPDHPVEHLYCPCPNCSPRC